MELYLLRHAIAIDRGTPGYQGNEDDRRPLTDEGIRKMAEAARGIQRLGLSFDLILSSPLPRAWETARLVAKAVGEEDRLMECPELTPEAPLGGVLDLLKTHADRRSLLLVGHEPGLSRLVVRLMHSGPSGRLEFKKGGLAKMELEFPQGQPQGCLKWLMPPRVLRAICRQ